jgi:hypothetical protein
MGVFKEIEKADGSGVTTFYRLSDVHDTVETDDSEGTATVIDYNAAQNKPSVNGVALVGNKTSEDLGLQPAGDYITNDEADAKFIDEDELEAKNYVNETRLQEAIANIDHFHREIVNALPVTGQDNVLYMVRKQGSGEDIFNEYIWVGKTASETGYEFIGTTATDLTDYYQKDEVDNLLSNKVDKVNGKGLSEQNYTLAEKTKLAGLENYDDTEIQAEVSGLNTDVDNLKSSNTNITNTLTELEPNVENNTAAVSTIYDLLDNKMTAIRLVEQGDGWVWMNLEGSRLTYAQASAALGHENCMLFIEQLENDGKVIPAEYKSEGDHINVIFKDLDSLVHVMTCGEDDAIVTEDITTTNGQANFTVEDEAVDYTTKITALYGDIKQSNYSGNNAYMKYPLERYTSSGTGTWKYINNYNGFDRVIQLTGNIDYMTFVPHGGVGGLDPTLESQLSPNSKITLQVLLKKAFDKVSVYYNSNADSGDYKNLTYYADDEDHVGWAWYYTTYTFGNKNNYKPQIHIKHSSSAGDVFLARFQIVEGNTPKVGEPYVGYKASPNPDYPQEVHGVKGNNYIHIRKKNHFSSIMEYGSIDNTTGAASGASTQCIRTKDYIRISPNTQYTVSNDKNYANYTYEYDKNYSIVNAYLSGEQTPGVFTFTTTPNTCYVKFRTVAGNVENDLTSKWQLELGSTNTTWEEYVGQDLPLSLGNIELYKMGTYQDKIYKQNDTWYLHKDFNNVILNGTTYAVAGYSDHSGTTFMTVNYRGESVKKLTRDEPSCFSNKLRPGTIADTWNGRKLYSCSQATNGKYIQLCLPYSIGANAEEVNTWLHSNNIAITYVLDTPTDTEIEDPTLLAQLNALEQITQYKNTYIIITGADLTPEADFTYIDNVVINNTDLVLGKDTYWNDEVPTSADLPSNAEEGEIRIVQDTQNVYIYDGYEWIPFDKGGEIDLSNYLAKDNTTAWIPTGAFNPATKKYVDDSVGGVFVPTKTSQLTNDSNFIGKNSNDLTYYYTKSQTYTKSEVDALIGGGGGGGNVSITVSGDTLVITTE